MKKIYLSIILFFVVLSYTSAQPVLLLEEFDYPVGDSLNQHGWTTNSGGATNRIMVTAPGLTYSGYPLSAGNAATLTTSGQDVNKMFSSTVTSGSVYVAFLFNVVKAQNSGDFFLNLGNSTSTTFFSARFYVKSSGTGFVIGISKGTEAVAYDEANVLNLQTTYLAVVKYTFNPNANDDVSSLYFINGALPATEPSTPTMNATSTSGDLTNAARIFLRQGTSSSAPNVIVDGIKVTTEWTQLLTTPVNITSFDLAKSGTGIKLTWTSAQEKNAKQYIIERSADNKNWSIVGTVAAKGNTSSPTNYSFIDANPLNGNIYYRLKIEDVDGSFEYYKTLSTNLNASIDVKLYPNPTKDVVYLSTNEENLHADVYNASGTKVLSGKLTGNTINISKLQAGIYFIKIIKKSGESSTLKIMKL